MSKRPPFKAFVTQRAKDDSDREGYRLEVGAVWERRDERGGYDLVIADGISLRGRVALLPPPPEGEQRPAE